MRVHVVSDVHGNAEDLARAGDGADALSASATSSSSSTTPTTRAASSPTCSASRTPTASWSCAPPAASTRPASSAAGSGRASTGRARPSSRPYAGSTPSCSRPSPPRRTPPTATSTCRRCGRSTPARAPPSWTASAVEIGGLRLRLRRRRTAHPDAHPVRDRRRGVRRQGRGARRGRRALLPHPARGARADATTPSPAASSAAARRCWTRSARTRPRYALFGHVHQPLVRRMRIGADRVRQRRPLRLDRAALGPGVVSAGPGGDRRPVRHAIACTRQAPAARDRYTALEEPRRWRNTPARASRSRRRRPTSWA